MNAEHYLRRLRQGEELTLGEQVSMTVRLSLPAILAQLSTVVMQCIDAAMVGRLGAAASASIGLVTSSTWLVNGVCMAAVTGFSVQVAQAIGAGEERTARDIMKQGFAVVLAVACAMAAAGAAVSGGLPHWLGGEAALCPDAGDYFRIFALALPAAALNFLSGSMLQVSGNMRLPSLLHVCMCVLDVVFNLLLIFPARQLGIFTLPGAGLGVAGAALGTALAQLVTGCVMVGCLLLRSPMLRLRRGEGFRFRAGQVGRGLRLALPVALEQLVLSTAQVASTRMVAPLGTVAIAANSFALTVESLCYMPGYGVGNAATAMIGQSTGAGRRELTRRLAWLITRLGMGVMSVSAAIMYLGAPWMIGLLCPDGEVVALGTAVLRIEAFAEPLFAASIAATGVFRGAGDTLVPSCLNFGSMWLFRIPLIAFLAPRMGLRGVWTAMCIELCLRGTLFLLRLAGKRWQHAGEVPEKQPAA